MPIWRAYPGLGTFKGQLGWTQVGEYQAEVDKANAELQPLYARFDSMKTEDIAADQAAMAIGERLFMNNCAQCHGSDARGSKSFPNLSDKDCCTVVRPMTFARPSMMVEPA